MDLSTSDIAEMPTLSPQRLVVVPAFWAPMNATETTLEKTPWQGAVFYYYGLKKGKKAKTLNVKVNLNAIQKKCMCGSWCDPTERTRQVLITDIWSYERASS